MDSFSGISLKREDVLAEARKAIPESTLWAIDATREAMRQRILQMGAFQEVSVSLMNRNNQTPKQPLEISVKFIPSFAAKAKGCPKKEGFCLIGRYQCKADPRTGCPTTCKVAPLVVAGPRETCGVQRARRSGQRAQGKIPQALGRSPRASPALAAIR